MLMVQGVKLGLVVSVEMNPATYSRLLVNLQSNIGFSAIGINAAVCGANAPSEILLTPSRGSTGYGMTDHMAGASSPHVVVKTTTFESLYNHYFSGEVIDICKIDIEGAEYDLIDSSHDDLLRKMRYLVIEFHDPSKTPPVIERLTKLGFSEMTQRDRRRSNAQTEVRVFRGSLVQEESAQQSDSVRS